MVALEETARSTGRTLLTLDTWTGSHAEQLYRSLGFAPQPEFWSVIVGSWLDNEANRESA